MQREGFDRLQAAMRSGGALDREIPFERCVDNSLAEQALADVVLAAIRNFSSIRRKGNAIMGGRS